MLEVQIRIYDKLKNRTFLIICILIMSFAYALFAFASDSFVIPSKDLSQSKETHGRIIKQPNGPFAVMIFNEFALGIQLGVIYFEQMGNPVNAKWWISERFWQKRPWSADITSLLWSKDSKYLYVGTASVYGDGGLFKLNLYQKSYIRLYPNSNKNEEAVSSTEIIGYEQNKLKLKVC